ncbi:hypothetical protein EVAR_85799_1 [Eumeta japonica]|uniref:Uncharacterized protein n=1 Tax=Eumeta variegata TaxID=151549 RepID=A0A4C1UQV1_EUMVA|nr:hypothetical protein EVAR_85799_1 [Eumeta japonica]
MAARSRRIFADWTTQDIEREATLNGKISNIALAIYGRYHIIEREIPSNSPAKSRARHKTNTENYREHRTHILAEKYTSQRSLCSSTAGHRDHGVLAIAIELATACRSIVLVGTRLVHRYGHESVYQAHVALLRKECKVQGHAPSNVMYTIICAGECTIYKLQPFWYIRHNWIAEVICEARAEYVKSKFCPVHDF